MQEKNEAAGWSDCYTGRTIRVRIIGRDGYPIWSPAVVAGATNVLKDGRTIRYAIVRFLDYSIVAPDTSSIPYIGDITPEGEDCDRDKLVPFWDWPTGTGF